MRTHLHLPVTKPNGDLLDYAEVTFLEGSAQVPTEALLYRSNDPDALPQIQPVLFAPGIIDIWCEEPHRFDVQVQGPDGFSALLPGIDLPPAPEDSSTAEVPNAVTEPVSEDRVLLSDGTRQYWGLLDVIAEHQHDGSQPGSTRLDLGLSPADATPNQTWVGADAGATQVDGTASTALGALAEPVGTQVSVLGQAAAAVPLDGAPGDHAVAIGYNASSVLDEVSLGSDAGQDVVGAVNFPLDTDGVARRYLTTEGTDLRHLVLSTGTVLGGALPMPPTPAGVTDPLWVLGDARIDGRLEVRGNASVGHSLAQVGFAGAVGAALTMLPATVGAPAALESLLAALAAYGLVELPPTADLDTGLEVGLDFVVAPVLAVTVDTPVQMGLDFEASVVGA